MRKLLSCISVIGLAALSLTACGEKAPSYSNVGTEITIWATEKEEAVIKAVVEKYNANQKEESSKFKYNFKGVTEADAGTTLAKDPTVEGRPALFLCADDHIFNLQSKGIVAELKGSYKEHVVANNSAVAVKGATYNDKLYGFPVTSDNGYFLWYNKAALSENDVKSLETVLQKAKDSKKTFGMEINNGWYANSFIMSPQACGTSSLTWAANAEGKVSYTTTWDNEAGVKVSEYANSLIKPLYEAGTFVTATNEVILQGFQDGSMIAAVSGTWMESDLKKAIGENLGAVKLPEYHIDGKAYQMASFTGSKIYCINTSCTVEEQKAAAALAELLTNADSQLIRYENRQAIPCNKEAAADKRFTENTTISAKALEAQNAAAACVQSQTAQDRYWDIGKAIGEAYLGKTPLAEGKTWSDFLKESMDTLRQHI